MAELTLIIANKNYSSWSLRAWLALKATGAPFQEIKILLDEPTTRAQILRHSPSGRVPALIDGDVRGVKIWESLAICEYLAERFPAAQLWPEDRATRALARAVSNEMHAGFADLRRELSMDYRARKPVTPSPAAQRDIDRVCELWTTCRERPQAAGGPFLFGAFTIADCMFAPVATRFATYGVPLSPSCAAYRDALLALPAMQEWLAEARTEPELPNH